MCVRELGTMIAARSLIFMFPTYDGDRLLAGGVRRCM